MSELVDRAKMIATILHSEQKYGEHDYVYHLQAVHDTLVRFLVTDKALLAAAWLHDAVEDQQLKLKHIEFYFGKDVAELVHCVTNETGATRKEKNLKTYPKQRANQEAVCLKLADRIANVTYSLATPQSDMWKMYKKEQLIFEYCVRMEGWWEEMWSHLNSLFEKGK